MAFILSTVTVPLQRPPICFPMSETIRRRVQPVPASRPRSRPITVISKAALQEEKAQSKSVLSGPTGAAAGIILHLLTATVFLRIVEGWAILDALYFSVVIATTVGYGDLTPVHPLSKIFVSFYAILSVALIAGLLQRLVERVADAHRGIAESAAARLLAMKSRRDEEHQQEGDIISATRLAVTRAQRKLRATIMMVIGACVSGGLLYGYFLKMSIVDVLYFLCVSMTTVGLGDIHPVSLPGKAFAVIWLVLTSLGFAGILSQYAELRVKKRERDLTERLLQQDIGDKMFNEIDGDGSNTLTEAEFLGYMMCKLGKASPDDVSSCFPHSAASFVCRKILSSD